FEEVAHLGNALDARAESAVADQACVAHLGPELRRERESDVDTVWRQKARGAVGPFHQDDSAGRQIVEAELGELGRTGETIEVGMRESKARQRVALQQGESR